jgi:hypothetical protein
MTEAIDYQRGYSDSAVVLAAVLGERFGIADCLICGRHDVMRLNRLDINWHRGHPRENILDHGAQTMTACWVCNSCGAVVTIPLPSSLHIAADGAGGFALVEEQWYPTPPYVCGPSGFPIRV